MNLCSSFKITIIYMIFIVLSLAISTEALKRCFTCRSRGDQGSCKDRFQINVTMVEMERGVDAVPCASGWCGKFLEGGTTYKDDDYGVATQRLCLQRGPSDDEERCDYTVWNHKKVYMCFCKGDLCNDSTPTATASLSLSTYIILALGVLLKI